MIHLTKSELEREKQREEFRQRSCVGKQKFASEGAAMMHIKPKIKKKERAVRRAYQCAFCKFYHLTSLEKK